MKRFLPNRPSRLWALLGLFLVVTVSGWSESRVWVQYAPGAKGAVMSALKGANGRVHYEFDNINAVAVSLPEQAVAGLSRNPNVALVEEDPIRVMSTEEVPYGIEMVQAYPALGNGATGAGITVGVIDSGVHVGHEDLPTGKLSGFPTSGQNVWSSDGLSHGTHVTGTIAALGNNDKGVIGVAPGVDSIYMVRVFGDTGNWVYSSSLLAAVQNAVFSGGADVVNMSLGGSLQSQTEKKGMDQLYNNYGVLLVAAAGNDGSSRNHYPASYASVVSVAAVDFQKVVADFSQHNSAVELAAPGVAVLSTTSYIDTSTVSVGGTTVSGHHVEFAARGAMQAGLVNGGLATSVGAGWNGKIVLVQRGTNSFYEKVMNVQAGGGVACVIYNNVAGDLFATLGDGNSSNIPAIGLSQAAGQELLSFVGQTVSFNSTYTYPANGYESWDGTSMATPHVVGVASLIWSKYPNASNAQVRQALTDTAEDLGAPGRDSYYGYGLVQASDALTRLGEIVGGGNPPPTGDTTPPTIGDITGAPAKGKAGTFAISFTTDESATCVVTVYSNNTLLGTATTGPGTNHSVKVQGTKGVTYSGTVTATDAAGNPSDPKSWSYVNN